MSQQNDSPMDGREPGKDGRMTLDGRDDAPYAADARWAIGQSEYWTLVLNTDQSLLGRCYLLLKRAETDALALTAEEMNDLFVTARLVRGILDDVWQPDHFNYAFLMNQTPQVHFHIIPRYRGRREFAGGTFVDPEFGSHYGIGPDRHLDAAAYQTILTTLRQRLAR